MKKNNMTGLVLSIISVATIMLFVAGATYAYFKAQGDTETSVDVDVKTATTDLLTFDVGKDINIIADQISFSADKTSLSDSTTAKATLTANNSTNDTTMNYYIYVNITNNSFKYTTENKDAELILSVTGPSGEVKRLDGLTYTEVKDIEGNTIKGFDVTTSNGLIAIANNKAIIAGTKSTVAKETNVEDWTITLTFVNYNVDQTGNAGSELSAKLIVQKEELVIIYHETCDESLLACKIAKNYSGTQGTNNVYYHDSSLANGAGDRSYRYSGASSSVNNYVCFGSLESTCPSNNLYRIIGVFNGQVKLIKDSSLGSMQWDSGSSNTWSDSSLNEYLNGTYLTSLTKNWSDKIADTTWKVGGNTYTKIRDAVAGAAYQNEIVSPVSNNASDEKTEYGPSKIALMYASDYGFAATSSAWTTTLYNYNSSVKLTAIRNSNWIYLNSFEWILTRDSDYSDYSYNIGSNGSLNWYLVTFSNTVRPVFYLDSSVTFASGDGKKTSPYRIEL